MTPEQAADILRPFFGNPHKGSSLSLLKWTVTNADLIAIAEEIERLRNVAVRAWERELTAP